MLEKVLGKKLSEKISAKHVTVGSVMAVPAIIWGVYAAADAANFELDRVAWESDVKVFKVAFESVQQQLDRHEILVLQDKADELELKIEREKFAGRKPSPEDVLKFRQIQRKILDMKALLQEHQ